MKVKVTVDNIMKACLAKQMVNKQTLQSLWKKFMNPAWIKSNSASIFVVYHGQSRKNELRFCTAMYLGWFGTFSQIS